MCGITGFLDSSIEYPDQTLRRMTDAIVHRGPDDEGHWHDRDAGVALGHRRLSILDLSPAGHQPMHSASGRLVIVFNGEIYNHRQLRGELERLAPRQWRGHSDTEVLLEAFETWGVESAAKRLIGMFAIALWDRRERVLHLMRDRIGEKPLYYGRVGKAFLFASELKSLRCFPGWEGVVDRDALTLLLRHTYIPAPHSIYRGIHKLAPGTILSLPLGAAAIPHPVGYWSARECAEQGIARPFQGTERQAADQLDQLLRDAVGQQMEADVPLGAFLSGGVDSSAVVAMMQAQSSRPVRTFTIGFDEKSYNEAEYAKAVAQHLGTAHTELYINASDALGVIARLPKIYDEPFTDSSQIPTFLVSQLTRRHVTVSLSGDGGDELFGGYNRYFWCRDIWRKIGWLSPGSRTAFAKGLRLLSPQGWDRAFRACSALLPGSLRVPAPGDKLHKLAEIVDVAHPIDMYQQLVSLWQDPQGIVLQSREPKTALTDRSRWISTEDFTLQMMYQDLVGYLPDDILVKVDRAAMAVSLETRVPFLDHRVVEFAWRLPLDLKIRSGQGKWLLRQVLYRYVPRELIERPKMGFGVPIDSWLRGPLRDWAEELLNEKRLKEEGYFDPAPIRLKWQEHLSGQRNWQYHLWDVLMYQSWLENTKSGTRT